jgi:hypothetical protein
MIFILSQFALFFLSSTLMVPLWYLGIRGPKEVLSGTQRGPKEENAMKNKGAGYFITPVSSVFFDP